MQYKTLVRTEHMNHNGCLFGGYMLLWVDEYAYIAAQEELPGGHFVTRAMEAANFQYGVPLGSVLTFNVTRIRTGHTSVTYSVEVFAQEPASSVQKPVFNTCVTMCNTDADGRKAPLPEIK